MSNFLTNLISRSLGAVEVVQPRIPSIFEPHRRDSGLLGVRPGFPVRGDARESAVEAAPDGVANPAPIRHRNNKLRPQAKSPAAREGMPAEPVEPAQIAPSVHTPETVEPPARQVEARLTPRVGPRPDLIAANQGPSRQDTTNEPNTPPDSRPRVFEPTLAQTLPRPEGSEGVNHSHADRGRGLPEDIRPPMDSEPAAKREPVRPPRPPEVKSVPTETSTSHADRREPAASRGTFEPTLLHHEDSRVALTVQPPVAPSRIEHQVSLVTSTVPPPLASLLSTQEAPPLTRVVNPPVAPSLVAQPAPRAPSVVRPPLASRSGEARNPEPLQASSAPPPAVQVSIGRVEVRAVFLQPAVRHTPPPRSRPTVSLDDYLNQRNRGRR
jgi:hypothetical protein